ncbi:P-loop NTPase [bacterium]|nr:P-loop NTPase [bacterium]
MIRRYTISQVALATGLEECEIRFYEQVFREYLTFSQLSLNNTEFTQDHVDLLRRIKDLIQKQGRSIDEVKRELKGALQKPASRRESAHCVSPSAPALNPLSTRYARVIAVTSGKGGVGKTFFTVNLAMALTQAGKRVAIFDADLGLANVHILLGVKPRFNLRHVVEDNFKLDDVIVVGPNGVKVISGGQGVREMANLSPEQRRIILRTIDQVEREVDILLVDTGAGISDNVLRFATFADEIVVVTTPNIAAAADGYSIIKILFEMEPNSKIGLVTNMVNNMYHSKNIFNRINTTTQQYLGKSLGDLGYVVSDPHVEASCQTRKPLMLEYPYSEAAKCVRAVTETILNDKVFVNRQKDSAFGDLMGQLKRTMVGM